MLEATSLACERGALALFAGVSLKLAAGELARVSGPNGSGKTSLLRMLAGLTRPAAGTVRWRGEPVAALSDVYGREMLFIGHSNGVKDDLTVQENVAFAARLSGLEVEAPDIRAALAGLGIENRALLPARYLSQGQRRRTALARLALAARVPLWILDEPFASLDAEAIECVRGLVDRHLAAGGLLVLTSHHDVALQARATHAIRFGD
jgi:heme exporter protein A